jgi:hypothetical protein
MAMTDDPWMWWGTATIGAAVIAAIVAILLIGWLGRRVNRRRRPPA